MVISTTTKQSQGNLEKTFVSAEIPASILLLSGKIVCYPTLDKRVKMLVICGDYVWNNRASEEIKFCPKQGSFILPDELTCRLKLLEK